ncbi:MAG: tetratricopeptide repeat protein [Pseudodesulfovibrio sp.]|jgi:tetratricopeptide (TPR) repeat protein|uniref:Tetratricopeptide repeat protein n=1 Tax=Pseudodesulfovibrio indicus TaxID=1716143 RepID=A0A126QS54_9BACT|nr:tetratricopeptide repeat protein [Pseudodesulfovibrio indicus]AMK12315.1 hypothetical protein AWY79_14970 [Pseudodesulfovibrio indicus]TDT90596.1 tetratricopeptide repeat protein [Pseudodesulfovibrio indicus]
MAEHEQTADNRQGVVRDGAEKIKGIFSTQTVAKVGTGTTQRKTIQKTYWNVEELDDGEVSVQPLNRNYVPSGPKRNVPRDDFLTKFNPEPEFYISTVYPAIKEMDGAIVRGEKHRERGAAYSAEFEYQQAMAIDEENVRANFGLGLTYLDRGDQVKANDIFERLVGLEAAFDTEHKHLFNDFGINMRKNKMYDQALRYYLRAEELVKNDEHLFHNIARCYFEKGNVEECKKYLLKSLEVNPKLDASLKFWAFLKGRGLVAEGEGPNVAPGGKGGKPKGGSAGVNLDAAREDGEPKTGDNGAPKKPASSAPIKLD